MTIAVTGPVEFLFVALEQTSSCEYMLMNKEDKVKF